MFSFDYVHLDEAANLVARDAVRAGTKVSRTLLVAKTSLGKVVFVHVVLQKGVDPAHYSVDALIQDIAWLGYTRLGLRSDNEPAILQLFKHALIEMHYQIEQLEHIVQEHQNSYDHTANVEIEARVKQVTGILRTNKLDLEKIIQREIPLIHKP